MFYHASICENAMRMIRLIVFLAVSLSLPYALKRDFKLPPSLKNFPSNPNWEMPPPTDDVLDILKGSFSYFSKGNQSSVFVSEDGKYVLKLFRYNRSLFPMMHWLKNGWKRKPKLTLQKKLEKTFNAAYLAAHEGQEFTQVLYCHLNLTENLLPTATLRVKKKTFQLPMGRVRFALQKKAEPFKAKLIEAKENREKMQQLIRSFATLLVKRSQKNIRNSDPNLGPNFGFLGNEAVEIDFGNYQKITPNRKKQKEEVSHFLISLEQWLAKCAPEYLEFAIDLRRKTEMAYDPIE